MVVIGTSIWSTVGDSGGASHILGSVYILCMLVSSHKGNLILVPPFIALRAGGTGVLRLLRAGRVIRFFTRLPSLRKIIVAL